MKRSSGFEQKKGRPKTASQPAKNQAFFLMAATLTLRAAFLRLICFRRRVCLMVLLYCFPISVFTLFAGCDFYDYDFFWTPIQPLFIVFTGTDTGMRVPDELKKQAIVHRARAY
jgi:hypothetical protein